jgi:cathepsin L
MKSAIIFLAVVVAASAVSLFDEQLNGQWTLFKAQHNKFYKNEKEETSRRLLWERNLAKINEHNAKADAGESTFWLAMNRFGDMHNEEFRAQMNGYKRKPTSVKNNNVFAPKNVEIPDSVDWRTQGYVTPIKDQGQCGSCWAFSAVAALEGQNFKKSQKLVSLSEQNLVDCSGDQGNEGCNGGLMDQAFTYIQVNNGIDTEDSYPYEAQDGDCRFKADSVGATDNGFVDVTPGSEQDLASAIATIGPISVAIDASQSSFQFYSKGIYYEKHCSSTELDHGVTAVGYGSQGTNKDYYIVKNSWGTSWGDQGYILMSRNKKNNCGIATAASYPTV